MDFLSDPESADLAEPPGGFRYRLQVSFPEPGEEEEWETINSFPTPREALRGCSQCYDTVRDLLGLEFCKDLEPGYLRIRILDAKEQRVILWEDGSGGLAEASEAFADKDASPPERWIGNSPIGQGEQPL